MGYDNFKIFFDKSIKQYHPYANNVFYSTLTSFLLDPFLKESYDIIPKKFIDLIENQIISIDIYDSILISLGYPESFISSISMFHKKILLNKFTNYYRYKSTMVHFKEICNIFSEPVNLYELYITKKNGDYFFTPKKIYESNPEYLITDLNYETVYNSVPNYFISKDLVTSYENNNSIAFPIKTNLLYFILSESLDYSDITILLMSITLYHFKDSKISILIYGETYIFNLYGIYQLWTYLLNLYSSRVNNNKFSSIVTYYDINNSKNIYNFENIEELITAYENIQSIDESYNFINEFIKPNFSSYPSMQIITIEELRTILTYSIDSNIIIQIENILNLSNDIGQDLFSILSEILLSIRTWILNSSDDLLLEYGNYIIKSFYLPFSNIDTSITYKLINLFKPYHTDIYTKIISNVIYKSNTDKIILKDKFRMATDSPFYTSYTIGDSFILKIDGLEVIL